MAHACELETSIYLAVEHKTSSEMDKAAPDLNQPASDYFYMDWFDGPGSMIEWWSTLSKTGTMGDPTLATAGEGEVLLNAAADELLWVIDEMKTREIRPRVDHH